MEQPVSLRFFYLSLSLGQALLGFSAVGYSSPYCLSIMCYLASIFCLIFALETSYTMSRLPFALEVIAQSLGSLVINMDS